MTESANHDMVCAESTLKRHGYTCVICKGGYVYASNERGIKPLVACHESQNIPTGASAADKVVGRGAAFMYVLLGVKAVYAEVISREAETVLTAHGIQTKYKTLVDNIQNRRGDGICPFEEAVLGIEDTEDAYRAIRNRMRELGITV